MEGEEGADKRLKFCNTLGKSESKIKWRERVSMSVAPQRSP